MVSAAIWNLDVRFEDLDGVAISKMVSAIWKTTNHLNQLVSRGVSKDPLFSVNTKKQPSQCIGCDGYPIVGNTSKVVTPTTTRAKKHITRISLRYMPRFLTRPWLDYIIRCTARAMVLLSWQCLGYFSHLEKERNKEREREREIDHG